MTPAGRVVPRPRSRFRGVVEEVYSELSIAWADQPATMEALDQARALFETVALDDDFADFLTLPAYEEYVA